MANKFKEDATVNLVFFEGEEAENQQAIFEGPVSEWREHVGKKWNGFDKGDLFMINEDRVRIFHVVENTGDDGEVTEATYFISFTDVNPNKLDFDKLKA